MSADREIVDRRDPRLLGRHAVNVVRKLFRPRHAAEDLVHVAEVPLDVPEEGNPAAVEMREIDPRPEDPLSGIFRMLDHAAAHDHDFGRGVENREVDGNFHRSSVVCILRVEVARVAGGEMDGVASPLQSRRAEIERAVRDELRQVRMRLRVRQQHRVTEMAPAKLVAEHMREKQALVDLEPVLVALKRLAPPLRSPPASAPVPGKASAAAKTRCSTRRKSERRSVSVRNKPTYMRAKEAQASGASALVKGFRGRHSPALRTASSAGSRSGRSPDANIPRSGAGRGRIPSTPVGSVAIQSSTSLPEPSGAKNCAQLSVVSQASRRSSAWPQNR